MDDQKIFQAWDVIHYALLAAMRKLNRPTLMFLAHRAENNSAVSDAAHVILEDMEIEEPTI